MPKKGTEESNGAGPLGRKGEEREPAEDVNSQASPSGNAAGGSERPRRSGEGEPREVSVPGLLGIWGGPFTLNETRWVTLDGLVQERHVGASQVPSAGQRLEGAGAGGGSLVPCSPLSIRSRCSVNGANQSHRRRRGRLAGA